MALARVKVWNPGDVLTASDLNGEFNNIINNPISLVSPTTGTITFTTAQNFPSAQVTSTGVIGGQVILQTTGGRFALSPLGGSRVRNLSGIVTSSQTATFQAEEYVLRTTDGKGNFLLLSTDSFTINVGTAGPTVNGRDVAGNFASTFVYWYAITTGLGSTTAAGIGSTSPPPSGPAMPTGYQAWAYLAASPYSSQSTGMTANHFVHGEWTHFTNQIEILSSGTSTSTGGTNVDYSSFIPPNAGNAQVQINHTALITAAGTLAESNGHIQLASGGDYYIQRVRSGGPSGNDIRGSASFIYPITSSQGILYYNEIVTGTSARTSLLLQGYSNPNGGF